MDTDDNVKPFSCSLCPSTFTQRGNLLRHIATIHEGKKRTDVPNSKLTEESYDIEGNLNLTLFIIDVSPYIRAVVSGGAGGALAPPEFGSSVNPIPTRGGRLCLPYYR